MDRKLKDYLKQIIIPTYRNYDKGHDEAHVLKVIANSMEIAEDYNVNREMVYVIAAFHDLGMPFGRKNHHLSSAILAYYDHVLNEYFTPEQLLIIKEAIEDHRASNTTEPRRPAGWPAPPPPHPWWPAWFFPPACAPRRPPPRNRARPRPRAPPQWPR